MIALSVMAKSLLEEPETAMEEFMPSVLVLIALFKWGGRRVEGYMGVRRAGDFKDGARNSYAPLRNLSDA